jgi:hypothetical protein
MLLKIGGARLLSSDHAYRPPTTEDCLETLFYLVDDNLDKAVQVADDPGLREVAIRRFAKMFSDHDRLRVAQELHGFLLEIFAEFPKEAVEAKEKKPHPDKPVPRDVWVTAVDIIAHQYHWREGFILWELPLVRLMKYEAAILRRLDPDGESKTAQDEISEDIMSSLDVLEEILEEKGLANG